MSRKRKKAGEPEASPISEGVPEDVLAEGSGPVQAVARVAIATDDQEPDPPVRSQDHEVVQSAIKDLRSSAEQKGSGPESRGKARKGKRGKTAAASAPPDAITAPAVDEASLDPVETFAAAAADAIGDESIGDESIGDESIGDESIGDESIGDEIQASGDESIGDEIQASGDESIGDESIGDEIQASGDDAERPPSIEADAEVDAVAEGDAEADAEGDAEADAGEGVAALPTSATELDASALKQLVEALVFASDKPMTVQKLRQLTRVSDIPRLEQALFELAQDYADRGIVLQQVSGGYQFRTRTQWSQWVQQLIAGRPVRLTRAQLETLAIIAYRQPITRPEIDEIRGVDSSATLKLLMDRQLIRILGKKEEVGRPMLYGTTKEFLDFFSLGDLRELPTLREYSELTPESRQVITDKLGDLPDDDGSRSSGPMGEGGTGGDSESSDLGAAPEPTAADLIAQYVAELDADSAREANAERDARDARIEEDERMVFDVLDDELDAAGVEPDSEPRLVAAQIANDAAELAESILAMESATEPSADAPSPDADLATTRLTNDAAELGDAILSSLSITYDLSSSSAPERYATVPAPDASSLAELERETAEGLLGQAPLADTEDSPAGSDVVRNLFADGSGGTVDGNAVEASPERGVSGLAAARGSMDPRPHLDEDSDAPIRTALVDPDADEVDAAPDPVE